jgi:hypothetical protein
MPPARGAHDGSGSVSGFPSVSASRMAVAGRQCWKTNLVVTVGATVSASAIATSAASRASSRSGRWRASATSSAIFIHSPGGCAVPAASDQYWNVSCAAGLGRAAFPRILTSARAAAYSMLASSGGGALT